MDSFLQSRIKNYLDATGLSVAALERKAGLKINVARNILKGLSKKPTAETLQAIANVMECTVQDLLGVKKETFKKPMDEAELLKHPELLLLALQKILSVTQEYEKKVTVKQVLAILYEVYAFSVEKEPLHIDMDFVKWFTKRTIESE